jgi:hypothetical protein
LAAGWIDGMMTSLLRIGVGLGTFLIGCLIVSVFTADNSAADKSRRTATGPLPTAEEKSEIYSALIQGLVGEEQDKIFVISESTWPTSVIDPDGDFETASLGKGTFPHDARLPVRYVLLGDHALENEPDWGGWRAIYRNYPGAQAYLAFSEIALNKARNKAFVAVDVTPAYSPESRFFLVKKEGAWTLVRNKESTFEPCFGRLRECARGGGAQK